MKKWRATWTVLAAGLGCFGLVVTAQQHQPQPQGKPDHMQHRFDDPERYAKSFDDPARDGWQMPGRVIEALHLQPGSSVADIGAGTGYFSVRLAKAVERGTVYAVDIEQAMLEHIRKRAEAERLQNVVTVHASGTGANLPRPVDVVLIVDTYHHLPSRPSYFRDLAKSLASGGGVARAFRPQNMNLRVMLDVFNIFNANTALVRVNNVASPNFNRLAQNLSPRIARIGLIVGF